MKSFLRFWSYLTNPIFIPLLVSIFYFVIRKGFDPLPQTELKLLLIFLLTVLLPLLLYLLLRVVGAVESVHLKSIRERKWPLFIYCALLYVLAKTAFVPADHLELYYFFIGVLLASITALIFSVFNFKISLHMLAMGGAMGFITFLSLSYQVNLLVSLAIISVIAGLTGTSRLSMHAHKPLELTLGFFTGIISQGMLLHYYL